MFMIAPENKTGTHNCHDNHEVKQVDQNSQPHAKQNRKQTKWDYFKHR